MSTSPSPMLPGGGLTRDNVARVVAGQVLLAPLTRGGNLPYRRLCVELGAVVTCSEMAHARSLARGRRNDQVLLRWHPDEPCFGVQLAARDPDDAVKAAEMAIERGARFVDLNAGCPIQSFCSKGLGAALLEKPRRLEKVLLALREALGDVPLFLKIRTGFRDGKPKALDIARLAEQSGVDVLTVHGRTRNQRYRRPADWELIGQVAAAVSIPVIGNGDILFARDARRRLDESGCAAVMAARGALIQPWIWEDLAAGSDRDRSATERLRVYRRWVELAVEAWGADDIAFARIRQFLELHVDFWRRYIPPDQLPVGADGAPANAMQERLDFVPRDDDERVLQATDGAGIAAACDLILAPFDPSPIALKPSPNAPDPSAGGWN